MGQKSKSSSLGHRYREFAERILAATSDAALIMEPDGMVLAANELLAEQLHTHPEEMAGKSIYDYFPPEVAERRMVVNDMVITSKAGLHYEDYSRPGAVLDTRVEPLLAENGEVKAVLVLIANISENKQRERERFWLKSAIEQAVEAFIIMDEHFIIRYVNQSFEDRTGYSHKEAVGRSLDTFYVGKKQQGTFQKIVKTLDRGEVWMGVTENTIKGDRTIRSEKTISPIRGKYGIIVGYVSIWRDVNKEAVLEKQLRQAQKLEAVGMLAGGIAHDFNNILGPVLLHAEMGLESVPKEGLLYDCLEQILEAGKRAKSLVNQLLNFSRMHEMEDAIPFTLSSIVKECIKLLRPGLPPNIGVEHYILTDEDVILADPAQIHQMIMNLCTNAAQSMFDKGGILRIKIEDMRVDERNISSYPEVEPGEYVKLVVDDTGHGIAKKFLEKIFDPFFTTKGNMKGTGLGLSVVQSIVKRLRGGIHVESEEGKGTTFMVLLPRETTVFPQNVRTERRNLRAKEGETILVVDDDPAMLNASIRVLELQGYSVISAQSGSEAVNIFKEFHSKISLVITDLTMPDMTGVRLAGVLHQKHPGVPILLTSGYKDISKEVNLEKIGVRQFIRKPYQTEELLNIIRDVLDETDKKRTQ